MINASELRIKTKKIHKRFLDAELQTIENNCLETATKEENRGAVFYCDFDLISNEACEILQENNYHVDPIVNNGETVGYRVRWDI